MAKLKSVLFSVLPLAAHCRFLTRVSAEINVSFVIISALGQWWTQFSTWLTEEKKVEDYVRKSALTELIENADKRLDRALTSIRAQVHALTYSLATYTAEAANRVAIMLADYKNVNKEAYEKQVGDVQSILRQFAGTFAADASTLGIAALINELQAALTLFEQLLAQRDEKSLLKPDKTFKEVRKGIEPIYHQIEEIINANAITNTSTTVYTTLINHLNPEIERLNEEFHRVRRDIAACEPEPIPQQTYTGRPLTPTPKVLFVTPHDGTIQLELGKDYNLTFKNNTEVGNAECTIHGKGGYKGSKTVTFIIIRPI